MSRQHLCLLHTFEVCVGSLPVFKLIVLYVSMLHGCSKPAQVAGRVQMGMGGVDILLPLWNPYLAHGYEQVLAGCRLVLRQAKVVPLRSSESSLMCFETHLICRTLAP